MNEAVKWQVIWQRWSASPQAAEAKSTRGMSSLGLIELSLSPLDSCRNAVKVDSAGGGGGGGRRREEEERGRGNLRRIPVESR